MCGLVSAFAAAGGLISADVAPAMTVLRPRGPDGEGVWSSTDGRAVLGHTRLAVIDPVRGAQPMVHEDGSLCLVANGEFYDYRNIRRELQAAGFRLHTSGDSEIALHLYLRDGPEMVRRLSGEFAFVLWDARRQRMLAVRDRFGIKPLYWARHAGRVYLASTVTALLAMGVPARWDRAAFAAHLQMGLPPDRTLFAGVHQVPPGCRLMVDARGVRVDRYWDLDLPLAEQVGPDGTADGAHVAAVAAALEEAVRTRTVADTPIACHLSGGLDSSTVATLAARQVAVTAFTVGFGGTRLDESAVAARTARALRIPHVVVEQQEPGVESSLRAVARHGEMLQENAHGATRLRHSAAIRDHGFPVVLSGDGGDELFLGYPQFHRDLELSLSPAVLEQARVGYRVAAADLPRHLGSLLEAFGFLPGWIVERQLTVTQPVQALLRPEFAAELAATDAAVPLLDAGQAQLAGRAPVHRSLHLFARTWLPNYILAAERLDAASAVEVRSPLLDHRLFEVTRTTPLAGYVHDGVGKQVLRLAMRDRLPTEVTRGGKRGFFAPAAVCDDQALRELRRLAGSAGMHESPFFEPSAVRGLTDRLLALPPARRVGSERVLQLAVGSAMLAEEFGLSSDRDGPA